LAVVDDGTGFFTRLQTLRGIIGSLWVMEMHSWGGNSIDEDSDGQAVFQG